MWSSIENIFKIPELKKRIMVTLGLLAVYRVGFAIPVPGVRLSEFLKGAGDVGGGGVLRFVQQIGAITGGDWLGGSVFALGIMPYISASIIFSLLQKIVPSLEQMAKEGEAGQQKLNQYSRYVTVALCLIQTVFVYKSLPPDLMPARGMSDFVIMFVSMTAGTIFIMWIGERITEYGLGNGISMIIMAGIISRMPHAAASIVSNYFINAEPSSGRTPEKGVLIGGGLILGYVLMVMAVIVITQGTRKITIQQAKHVRGTRVYGGQRSYLGLRVNQAGVMPVIFASPVMGLVGGVLAVSIIQELAGQTGWLADGVRFLFSNLLPGAVFYILAEVGLILFFSYFWTALYFNPAETAKNIKEYGSFIPGIRPGKHTSDHLEKIMNRVTLGGAAFLAVIAVLPTMLSMTLKLEHIVVSFLGGTGILIVVGVALDIVQKLESHLVMRHYDGFLGAGKRRIKGRRR